MRPILKTIISSLFKKSATILYPLEVKELPEISRGQIGIEIDKCIFCGICQRKCPTGAIEVVRNDKTWSIDRFNCVQCSACADNCPKKCLHMSNVRPEPGYKMVKELVEGARVSDNKADNSDS